MNQKIMELTEQISALISASDDLDEKIASLNFIREKLHEVSPFSGEPVDCVLWVNMDNVVANDYNPNKVAPPEMRLLYDSINCDGYTQPVVTGTPTDHTEEDKKYIVTDGYHRNMIPRIHTDIDSRVHHYLPVTVLKDKTRSDLMASTIRHNRARGVHDVDLMSNIVSELHDLGRSDAWISKHLGMDQDEILRLKQITGLAEAFKDGEFSRAWEPSKEIPELKG